MRISRRNNVLAALLAGFYALASGFGHAWHNHGDCPESGSACQCDSCPLDHNASETPAPEDGWRAPGSDSTGCLACHLMAQLRLGHAPQTGPAPAAELVSPNSAVAELFYLAACAAPFDARGPPAGPLLS